MNSGIFMQLCRLCAASKDASSTLTYLDSDNCTYLEKLNTVAPGIINLTADSELPNKICTSCIVQLNEAYHFINKCFKSHKVLKRYLQQLKSKKCVKASGKNTKYNSNSKETQFVTDKSFEFITVEQMDLEEVLEKVNTDNKTVKEVNIECDPLLEDRIKCVYPKANDNNTEQSEMNLNIKPGSFVDSTSSERTQIGKESVNNTLCLQQVSKYKNERSHKYKKTKFYKCKICNKVCTQQEDFQTHMFTHNKKIIYNCTICDKLFFQKGNLLHHTRLHTNDRFICKVCNKSFIRVYQFKKHMNTHANEK